MPHLLFDGSPDFSKLRFSSEVRRQGRIVMKVEHSWLRADGRAVLVEGVVVEYSRALHPVAVISRRENHLSLQLWPPVPVERNEAVQRWLLMLAEMLQDAGAGTLLKSNISPGLIETYGLRLAPEQQHHAP